MANELLTASRMESLLSCQRRHYWSYEVGLKAITDARALVFGKAWHAAMEARWQGMAFEDALQAATKDIADLDEIALATLSGMLAGYYRKYATCEIVKVLHPEIEFRIPIEGSRTFDSAGKIDGLAVLIDERQGLFEHKTTSDSLDADSDYWARLRFNMQIYQYVQAARSLGWNIEIVIYDVARKPTIAPKQVPTLDEQGRKIVLDANGDRVLKANGEPRETGDSAKGYTLQSSIETPEQYADRLANDIAERPDFYFARREVPILDQDMREFEVQRYELGKLILSLRQAEKRCPDRPERAWARNVNMMTCRMCPYSGFCLQNITVNLQQPPAGFQVGEKHQELAAGVAA